MFLSILCCCWKNCAIRVHQPWRGARSCTTSASRRRFVSLRIASMSPEAVRPRPLVSGDDLIAAGYAPGPRFKEILGTVEDKQLEGILHSGDEAMDFVRKEFPL